MANITTLEVNQLVSLFRQSFYGVTNCLMLLPVIFLTFLVTVVNRTTTRTNAETIATNTTTSTKERRFFFVGDWWTPRFASPL